jgi:hypothetical protein
MQWSGEGNGGSIFFSILGLLCIDEFFLIFYGFPVNCFLLNSYVL